MYIFFLSETDLHTRDFVHKSYESEITARDIDFVLDFHPTSLKINSEIRHVRWRKVATREERSPGIADAHIARSIARSRSLETPQRARAGTASLAKARGKFQPNLLIP